MHISLLKTQRIINARSVPLSCVKQNTSITHITLMGNFLNLWKQLQVLLIIPKEFFTTNRNKIQQIC